jgi:hypothetical protein
MIGVEEIAMPTLQLDAATAGKLRSLREPTEIVDDQGKVIGRFEPEPVWDDNALVPWDPSVTREELDRIAAAPGGRPLADILADLKRRSCTE